MGQTQSQRQDDYAIEGSSNEPVIIREVKPADKIDNEEKTIPVLFKWQESVMDHYSGVHLSGSFNDWQRQAMKFCDNEYIESIDLLPGKYEFKFFVDGEWKHDPKINNIPNKLVTKDDSSLCISCTEGAEGAARTFDYKDLGEEDQKYSDDGFTSDIPDMGMYNNAGPPPQLPVQLSRGILNAETDQSTDPTLLPEPQHVLLNHLYALTVRDGVMVLGATHRYKRKYVTTMLYKPILKNEY
ncbi:hypothetical protein ACHWQZ_G003841 [Mnemiopsis leidyi]